jgi:hypothetical protein
MTTTQQIIIAIVVILGVVGSFPASRLSIQRSPIYGGWISRMFHHLGVGSYIAVIPSGILGSLFVGIGFGLGLVGIFLLMTALSLYLFALVERPHHMNQVVQDKGWTEADARASGM